MSSQSSAPVLPSGSVDPRIVNRAGDAALVALVASSYFLGTKIGFALTPADVPIALLWPANAILLASLLLAPVRLWGVFFVALIPAHLLAQSQAGVPIATQFGWLIVNSGEALLGATLISGWRRRPAVFRSVPGVTRFLLFGFILAPLVTSFLDAAIVVGTHWGRDYWMLWITRLLSNMLAQVTIVPTIVEAGRAMISRREGRRRRPSIEPVLLGAAVLLVSLFAFRIEPAWQVNIPALIYLPLPLLLWAAMRFGPGGVSASLLTIAIVSIHSLMNGRGPFISASVPQSVLSMQVFLCMIGAPLLVLAVVAMEWQHAAQSLRDTSRKLINAQEHERQRIASELHDDIAQTLAVAELDLDRVIAEERHRPIAGALRNLRDQMTTISQSLWELSHGLYPWNLEYIGLRHALNRLCADLREQTSLDLHCDTIGIPERLPADVSLCLYRVAQEALQNIVRHSEATSAVVRLRAHRGRLVLHIMDDGIGFNQSLIGSGLGLASMRERLAGMDGGIEIDSTPGRGTRLDAWVALERLPTAVNAS
ncbi:MAG TPA: MASE1 domain-containing protein [Vicinamibacterales bacterium]|nr:MASE1 domain-containing protein [Vicinamibacterales bacterium]